MTPATPNSKHSIFLQCCWLVLLLFTFGHSISPSGAGTLPGTAGILPTIPISDTYDDQNHLIRRSETVSGKVITVLYDADGNRVAKTINGITTYYLVDTQNHTGYAQVIEEITAPAGVDPVANGIVSKRYAYGLDLISQQVWTSGNPLSADHWRLSYFGYDGLGSVRYLTDQTGFITDRYTYDAFGTLLDSWSANPLTPADNIYLYAGEQWDADLGLYYNRARYLNTDTGRFWSQDSYEGNNQEPLSLHKYLYVHGNPVNDIDPSGNMTLGEINSVMSQISTLTRMTTSVLRAASTVKNSIEFLATLSDIASFVLNGNFNALIREQMNKSTSVIKGINIDDAIESLLRHTDTILFTTFTGWTSWFALNYASMNRFVIYMPNAPGIPYFEVKIPAPRNIKKDLVLGFGSGNETRRGSKKAGRLTGLGVGFANQKHSKQIWRMDIHPAHDLRGDGDLAYWEDWPYHYHVGRPQ